MTFINVLEQALSWLVLVSIILGCIYWLSKLKRRGEDLSSSQDDEGELGIGGRIRTGQQGTTYDPSNDSSQ